MPLLDLPGSSSAGDLTHITLFRYATPLRDPAALLQWLTATVFCLDLDVSELLVIKERVYPSLDYEILHRLPLAPASPAEQPATISRSTIQRGSASDRRGRRFCLLSGAGGCRVGS